MAKRESNFINMVSTLFIIALISSSLLGVVYERTKGPIAKVALDKKTKAIAQVVPAFDNNPLEDTRIIDIDGEAVTVYFAKKQNKIVGLAIDTFTLKGFSGLVRLMVGILPDGTIKNIVVLSANETPGLGDKIQKSKSNFSDQFNGKNLDRFTLKVKQDGGDVDAITAATISSRAFCDAVQRAYEIYLQEIKK
ncbi:MAG: RnfABCDGE type electron transport complex subunit G [Candidatus Omnitrophica bacterium]|nr:RnfABCDGE type electron transport complex subunit G [Candidatus Omnitrophota bacterium]